MDPLRVMSKRQRSGSGSAGSGMSVGERASRFFERHRGGFAAAGALTVLGVAEAVRRRNQMYTEADLAESSELSDGNSAESPKAGGGTRLHRDLEYTSELVVRLKEWNAVPISDVPASLAIVDPAGMKFIASGKTEGAKGASKAVYTYLALKEFPHEVTDGIKKEGDAVFCSYEIPGLKAPGVDPYRAVVHVVGPDFTKDTGGTMWHDAVARLGTAYANVIDAAEYRGRSKHVTTVRLPVISGWIFAGRFRGDPSAPNPNSGCVPELTARAISYALQTDLVGWTKLNLEYLLCMGEKDDIARFRTALKLASSVKMHTRVDPGYPHNYARPAIKLPVTEVKHERGAVGHARALYPTLNQEGGATDEKIGLMIAGNNGRPGGLIGNGLDSIPTVEQGVVDSGVDFKLKTQEESVVSDWLDAVAGSEHEARSRVFRSTICGLWGQKARGSPETIQGVNYKTSTDDADYDRAWVVRDANLEHDGECTATLVFVAGPNANKSAGTTGRSMRETFSQKAHDEYPFFKKCVSVSVRAGLLAMREEKVTHALVAYVSGGLYAGPHKKQILSEFKGLVEQLVFDMEHAFTSVTVVDVS